MSLIYQLENINKKNNTFSSIISKGQNVKLVSRKLNILLVIEKEKITQEELLALEGEEGDIIIIVFPEIESLQNLAVKFENNKYILYVNNYANNVELLYNLISNAVTNYIYLQKNQKKEIPKLNTKLLKY